MDCVACSDVNSSTPAWDEEGMECVACEEPYLYFDGEECTTCGENSYWSEDTEKCVECDSDESWNGD